MNTNKLVLITGAHGFIGRNAAKYFHEQGFFVVGVGQGHWKKHEWKQWGVNVWFKGDITTDFLLKCLTDRPDCIIHCAGSGSVGFSYEEPAQDFSSNVISLLNVIEYIRKHSPFTRLVYPSSAAVYGNVLKLPINENDTTLPISPYGYNKKIAEELCRSYGRNYDISISIVRFFSVYGPGLKKQLIFDCCEKVRTDNPIFFGTGTETRDFLHVEDATSLLSFVANSTSANVNVFNGGTGENTMIKELVEMVFSYFDYPNKPIFNNQQRDGDPAHYLADNSKSIKLGWKPIIDIRSGVKEYVDWYKGYYLC